MNRIDRLTAIILLLQRGRRTASEIAHRFEVSKRTAFRDIQALCEMGVPIVTEAGAHGGYTLMPDYSLAPLQLTLREALLLRLALGSVSYRSERGASRQTILPRRLYCAAGFWYCEVYSLERREVRTYRVDRFVEVSPAPAPDPIEPSRSELPYEHPSHPEVRIRLTVRGVLMMERDRHLGDAIQPCGEEGGLLCFRCPEAEYGWLVHTLLGLGPEAEMLVPDTLWQLMRQAAMAGA